MRPRKTLEKILSGSRLSVLKLKDCMKDYHINIFFSEEDNGYIADFPDLPMCSAFGTSPIEALAEAEKAKKAWLEAAQANDKPVPVPRYRPAIYQLVS